MKSNTIEWLFRQLKYTIDSKAAASNEPFITIDDLNYYEELVKEKYINEMKELWDEAYSSGVLGR